MVYIVLAEENNHDAERYCTVGDCSKEVNVIKMKLIDNLLYVADNAVLWLSCFKVKKYYSKKPNTSFN